MKVAIIGATGFVGPELVKEGILRGYEVTAIARNTDKVEKQAGVTALSADVNDVDALASALSGHDAVINSFNAGWTNPNLYNDFLQGSRNIQQAVKKAGVKRFITIGGAGSLFIDGKQLVDSPEFPKEYYPGASAARDYLNELRNEQELDWTFLSPAINLHPGKRTGEFRLNTESPVFSAEGKSDISTADLAVAIFNELENNQFVKQRFTVGY
ncbi:NAD(P)-dependent oxidoreductase [Mucilaginibacter sp.]|uniref:NAD(P)-dependent oxidoreductase n=1 Tax=Mucilaginibacter sp. TaxID=1882438 RepID=UPI000CC3237E|nr:NAD(P)-dependent oxidoreductase [Mucilaginibacter sp.]PLW89179.1 MAG: histidine kinase [Mucilaginibacter sp.]PMP64982.1 MAG: histidine kinase [Mucilaginibacter sp.]HEK19915.1 NAD(P)-dependent oxidoreductase [Bacteroidota bacterium]